MNHKEEILPLKNKLREQCRCHLGISGGGCCFMLLSVLTQQLLFHLHSKMLRRNEALLIPGNCFGFADSSLYPLFHPFCLLPPPLQPSCSLPILCLIPENIFWVLAQWSKRDKLICISYLGDSLAKSSTVSLMQRQERWSCKSDISLLRLRRKGVGGWSELTTGNNAVGSFVCWLNPCLTEVFLWFGDALIMPLYYYPVPVDPVACSSCFPVARLELSRGNSHLADGAYTCPAIPVTYPCFYIGILYPHSEPSNSVSSSEFKS